MRPKNLCRSCSYTWFPRGNDIAIRCPNCKGQATTTVEAEQQRQQQEEELRIYREQQRAEQRRQRAILWQRRKAALKALTTKLKGLALTVPNYFTGLYEEMRDRPSMWILPKLIAIALVTTLLLIFILKKL